MSGGELIPRATIEQIVAHRDRALALYAEAHAAIGAADAAICVAHAEAACAHPGINGYNHHQAEEVEAFRRAVALPDRAQYLRTARKLVDADVWAWIVERTDLERLMDKEAKDELRAQMQFVPERNGEVITGEEVLPEVTVENVYATLERFRADAGMIFRRGIANAFSKLDHRFRSHDGFKVGSRVILSHAFNDYGSWSYHSHHRDTLVDIERTFAVLDGKVVGASYATTIGAIDAARGKRYGAHQTEVETEYFKVRIFKNGNAHLWMTRKDLVAKVNKILAEWYGEVIGDGTTPEADPLGTAKTTPARFYGFYPTPDAAAEVLLQYLPLYQGEGAPPIRVLEPSAGTGNLARRLAAERVERSWHADGCHRWRPLVDCVEVQERFAGELRSAGIYNRVWGRDFLGMSPAETGLYDVVVMNPPFDLERDIDHVVHAIKFLKPTGFLAAIMSAGTEHRETRKSAAFRALVTKMNGVFRDLPAGSFSPVGTNVNTVVLRVRADGRRTYC